MKRSFQIRMFGTVYGSFLKPAYSKAQRKQTKKLYYEIMDRASDIGAANNLLSSYCLAGLFIAMNRASDLTPEENLDILRKGFSESKLVKPMLGSGDGYFDEKKMVHRRKWSAETHKHLYKNDWVVDVLEGNGDYTMGFDYHECGVCKLCADEGCPELAKYLCSLDFLLVELIGIRLVRTGTLAEGADKCDFRFYKQ